MAAVATTNQLGGLLEEDEEIEECQYSVVDEAPFSASTPYWREKLRLCKIVASHPEGTTLGQITSELHGGKEVEKAGAEYQRARRFLNSHPTYFRVSRSDNVVSARPTLELLDLINGGIIQNHRESPQLGNSEFCAQLLRSVTEMNDKGRRLLEFNLREYVERINDLRLVLRSEVSDPEYVTLPYKTRFNDEGRINKQWSIMSSCIEKAGEWFDNAALLTLTTDPKKFDSLHDMVSNINDSWNRMMSWLASDAHLGYRPQYLKVLEFTEAGYPHIHAIVFLEDDDTRSDGMPWLESKSAISNYWGKYQGQVVDIQPLTYVDDLGDHYGADEGWVRWQADGDHGGDLSSDGNEDRAGQTAGEYLGKYLSAIYGGIKGMQGGKAMTDGGQELEATDGMTEKYEEKAETWKVAMYWATGRKIRTESRDLRQAVEADREEEEEEEREEEEEDEIPDLSELVAAANYEFVGAYPVDQLPGDVRMKSVPIDGLIEKQEEPEVPPGRGDGKLPKSRVEKMKAKHPVRAWPLIEGMMGKSDQ